MMAAQIPESVQHVAVIDDSPDDRFLKVKELRRMGFQSDALDGPLVNVEDTAAIIADHFDGALLDHALQFSNYAQFYGSELAAKLYDRHIPAVLVSFYVPQDYDVPIRRWRRKIPAVLSKQNSDDPNLLREAFRVCLREHQGVLSAERQPCRTVIQILRISKEAGEKVVDVLVPSWNANQAVRFPTSLVPPQLRRQLKVGNYMIAAVNTAAEKSEDLFFDDFELAPGPLPENAFVQTDYP